MGNIHVKFIATRGRHRLAARGLVDSGAETTSLSLREACALGLDVTKAKKTVRVGVGGGAIQGLKLDRVKISVGKRHAVLNDVFVPVTREVRGRPVLVANEEPLLGQDFLQASKSILDFSTDTLRGIETLSAVRLRDLDPYRGKFRSATAAEKTLITQLARCPTPKKPPR